MENLEHITMLLAENVLDQITNENHKYFIDIHEKEIGNDFIHALSNLMPNIIYNGLTNSNLNKLEFNHLSNVLILQYMQESIAKEIMSKQKNNE